MGKDFIGALFREVNLAQLSWGPRRLSSTKASWEASWRQRQRARV